MPGFGSRPARRLAVAILSLCLAPALASAQSAPDDRALQIARRALDAVREGWSLARYDESRQVRASINLRGAGSQGATANLVVDRATPRWRLDAAGGVGPLTLWALPDRTALHVPGLGQYATRRGGGLAATAGQAGRIDAEVAAMRARLDGGYGALTLAGEETIDGAPTWRLDDRPEPGTTASYWIDRATHLPRRIALDRPGRRDLRIDFAYGGGPRPIRAVAYLQGQRDVQVTLTPTYQASGRVVRLQVVAQPSGGSPVTTDVTFDWSSSTSAEFFRFTPPAGATEVSFQQLSQGVLLMAAGALGSLLPVLLGAT
ncbi:MAG TPA: hypothetical protein VMR66_02005 [Gemmatimonadota bacterium]|nr:hypothetical protein [Gemmatimonadota bacterium]